MKRLLLVISISFISVMLICSYFLYRHIQNTETSYAKTENSENLDNITTNSGKCTISVSRNLELLEVIQYLAGDPLINKNYQDNVYTNYTTAIDTYFTAYKGHSVFSLYKSMRDKGFSYGRVPELTLKINDNLKLKKDTPDINNYLKNSGVSMEELNNFLDQANDFYITTNFKGFYSDQRAFYNYILSKTKNMADKVNFIDRLTRYYGYDQESYNIIVYPLINGGFAERIPAASGKYNIYDFMTVPKDEVGFMSLIIHEFGHAYTGPLTYTKYREQVDKTSSLYEKISDKMRKQNYKTWENSMDEHINRAVTNRILSEIYGDNVAKNNLNQNIKDGFIYIDKLCDSLKKYETMRDKYPVFDDYYLELLKSLPEQ